MCHPVGRRGEDLEWKRPSEIVDDPAFFVDGATRFDVKQVWIRERVDCSIDTSFHNEITGW